MMCYNSVCLEIGSMCLGGGLEGSPSITFLTPGSHDGQWAVTLNISIWNVVQSSTLS